MVGNQRMPQSCRLLDERGIQVLPTEGHARLGERRLKCRRAENTDSSPDCIIMRAPLEDGKVTPGELAEIRKLLNKRMGERS